MNTLELAESLFKYTKDIDVVLLNAQGCAIDTMFIASMDDAIKLIKRMKKDKNCMNILFLYNGFTFAQIKDNKLEII